MHVLVASSSMFRQAAYREAVEAVGHTVSVASGGVLCVLAAAAAAVLVPQLRRYEA